MADLLVSKLNKSNTVVFILIIFLIIFTSIYYSFINNTNQNLYGYVVTNFTQRKIDSNCEIFNTNEQFSVVIDNQTYPKYIPLYYNESYNFNCINKLSKNSTKLILFWNEWFGDKTFGYGIGKQEPFIKNKCPITNCETTSDKNRLNESDMIVFHMRNSIPKLPAHRRWDQYWVFLLYESPIHSSTYQQYNSSFNLSATYRQDSNFVSHYVAYSFLKWGENKNFDENKDYLEGKTESAAIIVSNCRTNNQRLAYVKRLQKRIQVTIYGKCGTSCPTKFDNGTKADCKDVIGRKYKFYLAFENSICKDYVTEKFFDILRQDIIPVVYGGGPYDRFIPKSGYINAFDFDKPEDLADYLIYLSSNKTAYNSYFKWKKYAYIDYNAPISGHICELCMKLNLDKYLGLTKNVIDLKDFWNNKDCKKVEADTFKLTKYSK